MQAPEFAARRRLSEALPSVQSGRIKVVTSPTVVTSLVPVIAHAVAVFGDEQKATHWLSTPLEILGGRAPAELMVSAEGIALVERTLTRIEHNIPS
jgi:putative toxin-antitoxin system antitoxin component (TIGR02293 family)